MLKCSVLIRLVLDHFAVEEKENAINTYGCEVYWKGICFFMTLDKQKIGVI